MRTFLLLNDAGVRYAVEDAEQMVLGVATGKLDVPEIAAWIESHRHTR